MRPLIQFFLEPCLLLGFFGLGLIIQSAATADGRAAWAAPQAVEISLLRCAGACRSGGE